MNSGVHLGPVLFFDTVKAVLTLFTIRFLVQTNITLKGNTHETR